MKYSPPTDWSPADNPYAIAVSEAQWSLATIRLTVDRIHNDARPVGWHGSHQIDARTLVVALRQLLMAEQLQQYALSDLGMDSTVSAALAEATQRFEDALPGIRDMRDGLTHFEDWARGEGRGPQRAARNAKVPVREVARHFWGFGYDPAADTVTMGPYTISVAAALPAANELSRAIYMAARAVDARTTAETRSATVAALTEAQIPHGAPEGPVLVSPGNDNRVWVSIRLTQENEPERPALALKVVATLEAASLQLSSSTFPEAENDMAERLANGESLLARRP